jgi:hypothetical protein
VIVLCLVPECHLLLNLTKHIKVHLYEYAILERRTTQISTKEINPKQTHDYEYPVQNM